MASLAHAFLRAGAAAAGSAIGEFAIRSKSRLESRLRAKLPAPPCRLGRKVTGCSIRPQPEALLSSDFLLDSNAAPRSSASLRQFSTRPRLHHPLSAYKLFDILG